MFFGGFLSLGKSIWSVLGSDFLTLLNVRSPDPNFNPSPAGWAFSYHAISRIGGVLHDGALDRTGIDGRAAQDGKIVRLVELAGTPLPPARVGAAYSQPIIRKDHTTRLTIRDFGAAIPVSAFSEVIVIHPPSGPAPYDAPAAWMVQGPGMPAGLALHPFTGQVMGTPTAAGAATFQIRISTPRIANVAPVSLNVTP